ncbi:hypothetical protein BHC53_07015 [Snodgrassella alvi]|nr:hypothetical protein BHC53_07015 [Snodgrassella alvi]
MDGLALLTDKGIDEQVAKDFIAVWKSQKAPLTMTALGRIERETNKAGWTFEDVIRLCAEKGWRGFEAKWLQEDRNQPLRAAGVPAGLVGYGVIYLIAKNARKINLSH